MSSILYVFSVVLSIFFWSLLPVCLVQDVPSDPISYYFYQRYYSDILTAVLQTPVR